MQNKATCPTHTATLLVCCLLCACGMKTQAQSQARERVKQLGHNVSYRIEGQSTFSDHDSPLWLNANKYGLSSISGNNGYIRVGAFRSTETDSTYNWKFGYGIDMAATQHSKLLTELPPVDIVITMGCNVQCPNLPCNHREDWGLADPTGKDEAAYRATIAAIEQRILQLKAQISAGQI